MVNNGVSGDQEDKKAHPYINLSLDYDVLLWFDVKESIKLPVKRAKHKIMKQLIEAIIEKGVGDRISRLTFGKRNNEDKLVFAFNLNPATATVNYIRGPSIDSVEEAADFRVFWAQKTEVRRYPDLMTCETMYLPVDSISDRRQVTISFIKMLLEIHLGIPASSVHTINENLNELLRTNVAFIGTGEEEISKVNASLTELTKLLRNVKSEHFEIHSLHGISAVCRGSEVDPPVSGQFNLMTSGNYQVVDGLTLFKPEGALSPVPSNVKPVEVLLQLEVNNIYSDEIEIVRAKKIQIITQLCQLVQSQMGLRCKASSTFIDVFFEGLVFRLIVYMKREVSLLRQVKSSLSVYKESLCSNREAEELHVRNEILPKLTASLNAISSIHSSFSVTCRLVKRWLSSHCLLHFFSPQAIELIVAQLFISPQPFSHAPNSPACAFIRALNLLATFPFSSRPFVVNLNDELSAVDVEKVEAIYSSIDKKPGLFIATPYDAKYGMFSRVNGFINSPLMTKRMQMIACEWSSSLFCKIASLSNEINLKDVFVASITDAHVILYLKDKFISPPHTKVLEKSVDIFPITDFNPVSQLIHVLKDNYDSHALFMYDEYSGNAIYVFWKNEAFQPVTDAACKIDLLANNSSSLVPDLASLIENWQQIGAGIVQRVVVNSHNWPL